MKMRCIRLSIACVAVALIAAMFGVNPALRATKST